MWIRIGILNANPSFLKNANTNPDSKKKNADPDPTFVKTANTDPETKMWIRIRPRKMWILILPQRKKCISGTDFCASGFNFLEKCEF